MHSKEKRFFATEAGKLTLAFLVILLGAVVIRSGLHLMSTPVCAVGLGLIVLALLSSPVRIFVLKPKK
jgi:hypothetical protein